MCVLRENHAMLSRPVLSTKPINHLSQVSGMTKQCGISAVVAIQAELIYAT